MWLWGTIFSAISDEHPMPADAQSRIAEFSELVATAISNVQAQAEVERLLEEQAALRRVATLVAEGDSPNTVLDTVAAEMERALGADGAMLLRYEPDDEVTIGLLETAIANADSRDQLTASRARLVTEADEARRRVVRDLHDGAQQRLVQAIVTLKLAQRALAAHSDHADALIAEALAHAQQGNAALRELAHGILPAVLTRGRRCAPLGRPCRRWWTRPRRRRSCAVAVRPLPPCGPRDSPL
jgi:signal transduction histidine kinase